MREHIAWLEGQLSDSEARIAEHSLRATNFERRAMDALNACNEPLARSLLLEMRSPEVELLNADVHVLSAMLAECREVLKAQDRSS